MKHCFFLSLFLLTVLQLKAQKYITKSGFIEFSGESPFENVKADNNQVESILDAKTGEIEFHALMRSFHFKKQVMEDEFNKNFVESDKYPQSEFKGKILNISQFDLTKDGNYPVTVAGEITIHNVTRSISHSGILTVKNKNLMASSEFIVHPEDYNIKVPTFFGKKIVSGIIVKINM